MTRAVLAVRLHPALVRMALVVGPLLPRLVVAALVVTALPVAALVVTGLPVAALVPARSVTTPVSTPGARIELAAVSPPVAEPGSAIVVRVAVHNDGPQALPAGLDVDLLLQRSQLSTRSGVAEWAELSLDDAVGSLLARQELAADLPPGAQVGVDFAVPAADLRLPAAAAQWGPRGVSLLLRRDDGERLAVTRTYLLWYPARGFEEPTTVSVVLPMTAGAPDPVTGVVPLERLRGLTAARAPLDAVLTAAATPGVTIALDPAVIDPAALDAAVPTVQDAGSPDPALAAWTSRLLQVTGNRETVLLPYGDADLSSLAHAEVAELARLAQERGRDVVQRQLGSPVRTDVAWPLGGGTDAAALRQLRPLGYTGVVLTEGAHAPVREQRATLTGRGTLEAGDAPVASLLADTPLSDTLAAAGESGTGSRSPVAAVQRLLAETAAVTLQRPSDARHLLVTAPRGWAPEPTAAVAAVHALTAVPWVAPGTLQALLDAPVPDVERSPPTLSRQELAGELPGPRLRDVLAEATTMRALATAVPDPASVAAPAQATAVALASGSWRDDVQAWQAGVEGLTATRAGLQGAVRVVPGSPLTQVSREVELPVTVENTLDVEVSVVLGVESTSSRLVVTPDVAVRVPARSTELAQVPVRGVGSGDADVVAQVRAPGGAAFGDPVTTRVTVRADWETRATLAVAIVAGLVLVVGLVRTIVRGRRPRGHDPLAGAGGTT